MENPIFQWVKQRAKIVSISLFFIWAILMVLLARSFESLWGILSITLLFSVNFFQLYFGSFKDENGKRSALGMTLGVVATIYTLSIALLMFI